jgi:hypothetical protein
MRCSYRRLGKVELSTRVVYGNCPPILTKEMVNNVESRFGSARITLPLHTVGEEIPVIIHYRLEDMLKMPS